MKMRFIKQNLLLDDDVFFMNNKNHPPQSELDTFKSHPPLSLISTSSMQRFKGGGLNLTSNYDFFLIHSFVIKSFPHKIIHSKK